MNRMIALATDELEATVEALTRVLAGPDDDEIPHEVYDRALDVLAGELASRKARAAR
jgi:hypothetical protein